MTNLTQPIMQERLERAADGAAEEVAAVRERVEKEIEALTAAMARAGLHPCVASVRASFEVRGRAYN